MIRSSGPRAGLAGALAAATVLAGAALGAAPASAHTALKSSDPKANAQVAPPAQITLTYTETIRLPRVIVTGADGAAKHSGTPKASGDTVTQPLNGTLPNGTYTVGWRVVSADGHPVTGSYKFTVKGGPAAGAGAGTPSSPGASASPLTANDPAAGKESDGTSSGWLWIGVAALVIVLGVGGVAWARRPGGE